DAEVSGGGEACLGLVVEGRVRAAGGVDQARGLLRGGAGEAAVVGHRLAGLARGLPQAVEDFPGGAGHQGDAVEGAVGESVQLAAGAAEARGIERKGWAVRSEEHTSELQSRENLVCRLLLEKKNSNNGFATRIK